MAAGRVFVFEDEGARWGAADDDGGFAQGQHGAYEGASCDEEVLGGQWVGGGALLILAFVSRGFTA